MLVFYSFNMLATSLSIQVQIKLFELGDKLDILGYEDSENHA